MNLLVEKSTSAGLEAARVALDDPDGHVPFRLAGTGVDRLRRGRGHRRSGEAEARETCRCYRPLGAVDLPRLQQIKKTPRRYIEIPVPDHGQVHEWFRNWLAEQGLEEEYFGSIGGWIEQHGGEDSRHVWESDRMEIIFKYVKEKCRTAGYNVRIE